MLTRTKTKKIKRDWIWGWGMSALPILGFILFGLIPLVMSLVISFTQLRSYRLSDAVFNGLENYKFILTDPRFGKSIVNTLYAAVSLPITLVLALLIALLLAQEIRLRNVFRAVFFLPYICSMVAVMLMWKWIFDSNYGIINQIIQAMGGPRLNFLNDAKYFMPVMIFISVWSNVSFDIILYQAALTNINSVYYEAASLDGASAWSKFVYITLPALTPTIFYLLTMGLIWALQDFARFQVMAGNFGGPEQSGLTIVFYLYNMAFRDITSMGLGLASAAAWILTVMIVGLTILNFKLSDKWVSYD